MSGCLPLHREAPSREWHATAAAVTDAKGARVIGTDPERRSVLVVNDAASTGTVYLTTSESAPTTSGYPLAPGEGVTLSTSAAVFARCPTGSTATVKAIAEIGAV